MNGGFTFCPRHALCCMNTGTVILNVAMISLTCFNFLFDSGPAFASDQKEPLVSLRWPAKLPTKHHPCQERPNMEGAACPPEAPEETCGCRGSGTLWYWALHPSSPITCPRHTGNTNNIHIIYWWRCTYKSSIVLDQCQNFDLKNTIFGASVLISYHYFWQFVHRSVVVWQRFLFLTM